MRVKYTNLNKGNITNTFQFELKSQLLGVQAELNVHTH